MLQNQNQIRTIDNQQNHQYEMIQEKMETEEKVNEDQKVIQYFIITRDINIMKFSYKSIFII